MTEGKAMETENVSYGYLAEQVSALRTALDEANRSLEWYKDKARTNANNMEALSDYLKENRDELELHAESIADIFGISLTRTYEVTFTVEYTFTVESDEKVTEEWVDYNYESATLNNEAPDNYSFTLNGIEEQ